MKKLTDTQKKWALSACLASVLSFNLVMGLAGPGYNSASFASEEAKAEEETKDTQTKYASLISDQGEQLKVKYILEGEDKTVAIVPEKLESGFCYSCGTKYLLPKNFDSSADSLEMALRKAMSQKTKKVVKIDKEVLSADGEDLDRPIASKRKPRVELEDEEEVREANPDFVALHKRCDAKEDDSRLSCFAKGLTKLLKDKKKNFAKEEVMELFREEVEPGLKSGLADISDLLPKRKMRNDPFGDLGSEESTRRQDTQNLVEDMIAQISKKYNYLRQRLTAIAAKAVLSNEEQAQMRLKQAEQIRPTDSARALMLQSEGYARMNAANQIANQIGVSLYSGLESAQWSNHINQDQFDSLYHDNYANVVSAAIKGLTANPLTYVIPSVTLSDGSVVVDQTGQSFVLTPSSNPLVQQRTAGRGITVLSNGLTAANVPNSSTPRIAILNGTAAPGTATIRVFQATQAPATQLPPGRMRGQ